MRRLAFGILLVAGLVLFGSLITLKRVLADTSSSPDYTVSAVGHDCPTNACAVQQQLRVDLPAHVTVDAVHCLTTANYQDDTGMHEVGCTTDNAWSVFDEPRKDYYDSEVIVWTTYYNRSGDRQRRVRLTVDWH